MRRGRVPELGIILLGLQLVRKLNNFKYRFVISFFSVLIFCLQLVFTAGAGFSNIHGENMKMSSSLSKILRTGIDFGS